MGVQLNIKSAEARALAEQVAAATGMTITEAVTEALKQQLGKLQQAERASGEAATARAHACMELLKGSRALWKPEMLDGDPTAMLYDKDGVPF